MLEVPRTTLRNTLKRFRQSVTCARRPGQGRKRCTAAVDDRFMVTSILRNRFQTAVETARHLNEVRGVQVSRQTVVRRLSEHNLTAHRPYRVPELLASHRRARLCFAREHLN